MDWLKLSLRFFWLGFICSSIVVLLAIFAPDMLSQSRFVSGTPISLPERIAYPSAGISGFPPCNSRTVGKSYMFQNALYSFAECDGTTWDHWIFGNTPVIPPNNANFSWVNQGIATVAVVNGAVRLNSAPLGGNNIRLRVFPYPGAGTTTTIGFTTDSVNAAFHAVGLALYETGTGEVKFHQVSTGGTFAWSGANFPSVTGAAAGLYGVSVGGMPNVMYLRFTDTGAGTWQYSMSRDFAQSYHLLFSEAANSFLTPDRIGFAINVANGACPLNITVFHCDVNGVPCG